MEVRKEEKEIGGRERNRKLEGEKTETDIES